MGMAAMLVMWPKPFEQLFFPKCPEGCIWILVAIGPAVLEEKSFEIVDGRRTDDGACLYYKLPRSLRLRWAKKLVKYLLYHRNKLTAQSKMVALENKKHTQEQNSESRFYWKSSSVWSEVK